MFIRNIRWPEDAEAILEHIRLVHGPGDEDLLAAWYGSAPYFDPDDCFVIDGENAGEIAAHAMIITRQLRIGESVLPTAEIGVVGVLESYRGQGLARALLDVIHERMTERGDALGLIFGIPNFYERWGYEYAAGLYLTSYESEIRTDLLRRAGHWDSEHSYERRTADRLGMRGTGVTVRRFYASDLPAVQALYYAESVRGHYLVARDDLTWKWQLDYMTRIGRNEPDDFLVAEVEGRVAAYARLVSQGQVNWFREAEAARFSLIEAAGEHPDAIEALLAEIARTAVDCSAERVALHIHPASTFMRHLLARGAVQREFTGAGYLRVHNLALALQLLVPTLEARRLNSRYALRGCRLSVLTEQAAAEVILGSGDPEPVELEIPSTALIQLITGWAGLDCLGARYPERWEDLLRVLFPRRDPKIGLADLI